MDAEGNVYSPARYIEEAKVKDVNARCADVLKSLPSVDQARDHGRQDGTGQVLTRRKAARLVKTRLRLEISNDPKRPPRASFDLEEP